MHLTERFISHIKETNLFSQKDSLWLAVSGGLDSVVLTELCARAGFRFQLAHCNFQLRGEESDRDARFVEDLARHYQVQCEIRSFDTKTYAANNSLSTQEAARELRYHWFESLMTDSSPILLTAHHADDNIETLLMHFFRGTGLHGLTGIPARNGYIRRPLLIFTREELLAFAREAGLQWVEDRSNADTKYTRNYFRNELIPSLEKIYPQVRENLLKNINRFQSTESLYQLALSPLKKKLLKPKGAEWHIPYKEMLGYRNRALVFEIISGFGFTEKQIDEVEKLAASVSGRFIASPDGRFRIIKHRHWFIVSRVADQAARNIIISEGEKEIRFPLGVLTISEKEAGKSSPPLPGKIVEEIDQAFVSYPLLLRPWKNGDYFYPLGMRKKKKIARFLIDAKLSKTEKEKIWVLESNQRILWVIGQRIDDRCKQTSRTRKLIRLELDTQAVTDL